jgi:DNA-binding NarL/FixJ family response regulator
VTATRRILEHDPEIRVLALTMHEDDASVLSAIRAGARGYVVKGDTADAVLRAIVAVAHGEVLFGADVADRIATLLDGPANSVSPAAFPELTDREREALRLIGRGYRNALIATQMHVTQKTVRNYVSRIFAKLMVSTRVEAVIRARDAGLS